MWLNEVPLIWLFCRNGMLFKYEQQKTAQVKALNSKSKISIRIKSIHCAECLCLGPASVILGYIN